MSKFVAFGLLSLSSPCLGQHVDGNTPVNDPEYLKLLNSIVGTTWAAGHNDFFESWTFDDARPLMGTALSHISDHLDAVLDESVYGAIKDADIPDEFDSRTQWPGLIHPIRNQKRCGSCWAFSSSEVLSDRVAIVTNKPSPVLSPEDMVSCDTKDYGCRGGTLPTAWEYLEKTGIVTDDCFPYTAGNGTADICETSCVSSSDSFAKTRAKSYYAIKGPVNVQKEIMMHGPVQTAFMVYKSFMSYKSGVYQKHFWEIIPEGGHAVKIVGWGTQMNTTYWGTEMNTPYWLVANSWSTTWGIDGFFKILRGKNHCGIEKSGPPYAGIPAVGEHAFVV